MTRNPGSAPQRARDDQASARGTQRLGPQRGKRDADDDEEKMSRTGELVISLQGQVETLTAAVRTLARQIPAPLVSVHEAAERLGVSVNTVRAIEQPVEKLVAFAMHREGDTSVAGRLRALNVTPHVFQPHGKQRSPWTSALEDQAYTSASAPAFFSPRVVGDSAFILLDDFTGDSRTAQVVLRTYSDSRTR